jgi:hypothetical protein
VTIDRKLSDWALALCLTEFGADVLLFAVDTPFMSAATV